MEKIKINCNEVIKDYLEVSLLKNGNCFIFESKASIRNTKIIINMNDSIELAKFLLKENGYKLDGSIFDKEEGIYNLRRKLKESLKLNKELAARVENVIELQPSNENSFFMCYIASKKTSSEKIHENYLDAKIQAETLSKNFESDVYILESIAQFKPEKTVKVSQIQLSLPK
jgi:hypothetical protein